MKIEGRLASGSEENRNTVDCFCLRAQWLNRQSGWLLTTRLEVQVLPAQLEEDKGTNWYRQGIKDNMCKTEGSDGLCKNA